MFLKGRVKISRSARGNDPTYYDNIRHIYVYGDNPSVDIWLDSDVVHVSFSSHKIEVTEHDGALSIRDYGRV